MIYRAWSNFIAKSGKGVNVSLGVDVLRAYSIAVDGGA